MEVIEVVIKELIQMENEEKSFLSDNEMAESILNSLESIRDELCRVNQVTGSLQRYLDMRSEIEQLGWVRICEKYHPDINVDDPAAFELFEFYKYTYSTMDRKETFKSDLAG